jgi:uncharacterized membrane protein YphA (DoxX/SURF4 family)
MTTHSTAAVPPGVLRRFGFRFFASYMLIYNADRLLGLIPFVGNHAYVVYVGWNQVVFWTERVVLGMATMSSIRNTGSGDTSFLWVMNGCMAAIALAAALVWSFFDRDRRREPLVRDFVRVCVRYSLAATLIGYGVAKLAGRGQFPAPSGPRLLEPIGRLSPMGMLWVFMGSSRAYTAFSAVMEMLGGFLLLFRRTTPLGSIVSAGVVLNIVVLNFCYDVPVKLFSTNLLLMAGFLAWPDLRRMANVLVMNRPTQPAVLTPPWRSRAFRGFALALKVVVIGSLLFGKFSRLRGSGPEFKPLPPSVARLSGFWYVDTFQRDGAILPPLISDETRWRRVVFVADSGALRMIAMNENNTSLDFWLVGPDSGDSKLALRADAKDPTPVPLSFAQATPDQLELSGSLKGHPLVVTLHRADKIETRLFDRGFHWVSEEPFNR